MDNHINLNSVLLTFLFGISLFFLTAISASKVYASPVVSYTPGSSSVQLAYYYRERYPRYHDRYRYGSRYYRHRYYWTSWHRTGHRCKQRCLVNNWGKVVRCTRRCY